MFFTWIDYLLDLSRRFRIEARFPLTRDLKSLVNTLIFPSCTTYKEVYPLQTNLDLRISHLIKIDTYKVDQEWTIEEPLLGS